MKPHPTTRSRRSGHALVIVLVLMLLALLVLGATMDWTSTNARLIDRNNDYFTALSAAEAATEKVMATLSADYQSQGAAQVTSRLSAYRGFVPEPGESDIWNGFSFSDGQGNADATFVSQETTWGVTALTSQYQGLSGYAAGFRIASHAQLLGARQQVTAAVQQDFQVATIPIFQFAVFYNIDLEIHPGATMNIRGRVHSNRQFYSDPGASLTFHGDVTAAGEIIHDFHPLDPRPNTHNGTLTFNAEHDGGVNTLNLPLGVENTEENVRQIVEKPPSTELATSAMGQQRFYNKSDLVIEVFDDRVEVHAGGSASAVSLNHSSISGFVRTNVSFYNKREAKTVKTTQIDVGALKAWNDAGNPVRTALGRDVNSLWVADRRAVTSSQEPGIRLVNGQTLPSRGLTVATPQPLYVSGHYNAPASALGTADTSHTKPAGIIADAVTLLSGDWDDADAAASLSSRKAANTTVNAAILAGIVTTSDASYSGGVENFPRFLEDWSGRTLTYNGSMIVMFPSQYATGTWKGTGSAIGIYNAPSRNWAFDMNFLDPNKLPPGTPAVRTVIRGQWSVIAGHHAD